MAEVNATATLRGLGPMGKAMSVAGIAIGVLVAVMFTLDLFLGIPFGGPSLGGTTRVGILPDIAFALCGAILAYLGWSAMREAK
jgi:hypothetical protein